MLLLVEKAAGQIPEAGARVERATTEEHASPLVEANRLGAGNGVGVADVAAGATLRAVLDLLDSLAAERTEAPAVECTHEEDHARSAGERGGRGVSPRAAGATQHELSRIGLLATLSG